MAQVKPLDGVTARAPEELELLVVFDALRYDADPEPTCQLDHPLDDRDSDRLVRKPSHEALIDLQHIDGQRRQVIQRRVTGAKLYLDQVLAKKQILRA